MIGCHTDKNRGSGEPLSPFKEFNMVNTGRRMFEIGLEQYRLEGVGITGVAAIELLGDAEEDRRINELLLMVTVDRFHHPNG